MTSVCSINVMLAGHAPLIARRAANVCVRVRVAWGGGEGPVPTIYNRPKILSRTCTMRSQLASATNGRYTTPGFIAPQRASHRAAELDGLLAFGGGGGGGYDARTAGASKAQPALLTLLVCCTIVAYGLERI